MATPSPHDVCAEVTVDLELLALSVTLPGAATISLATFVAPNAQQYTEKLMAQLNAALTPLVPFFKMLDAMLAIKGFAEAVPGVVTNPGKVVSKLGELATKIGALAELLPQVSIPITIRSILTLLVAYVAALRSQVAALVTVKQRIAAAQAKVTVLVDAGAPDAAASLLVTTECAQLSLAAQMTAVSAGAAPFNRLIGVINLIGGLIGLPEIPAFTDVGTDPELALAPIDALSKVLEDLRSSIPG